MNQVINMPQRMTLYEICKLTGTHHSNTMRRVMPKLLELKTFIGCTFCAAVIEVNNGAKQQIETYKLTRDQSLIVAARLDKKLLEAVVLRWLSLEELAKEAATLTGNKKDQKLMMAELASYLPGSRVTQPLSYIKADTIVNKAVSNYFGYEKLVKKADMTTLMLEVRDNALDDFVRAYEIFTDYDTCKDAIYKKYQQPLLTNNTGE